MRFWGQTFGKLEARRRTDATVLPGLDVVHLLLVNVEGVPEVNDLHAENVVVLGQADQLHALAARPAAHVEAEAAELRVAVRTTHHEHVFGLSGRRCFMYVESETRMTTGGSRAALR